MRDLFDASFNDVNNKVVSNIIDKARPTCYPDDLITTVRKVVRETGARVIPVIGKGDEKLLGVIRRGDILMVSSTKTNAIVSSIMSNPVVIINGNSKVSDALKLLLKYDEWNAPVVNENNKYISLLTLGDIIKLLVSNHVDFLKSGKVEECMSKDPISVNEEDYLSSIWKKMTRLKYAGFPVTNEKGVLTGIITQFDLLKKGYARIHLESESGVSKGPKVKDVMSYTVKYLYPWSSMYEAAKIILERGYGRIPIVFSENNKRLVGIIDREDVAKLIIGDRNG
ncbi:MAG: CBS domain-containing protein [Caldisphaeraceae archaeon]|nr:CBS domain-containing protein [Caldisphaeraceae archaeon]